MGQVYYNGTLLCPETKYKKNVPTFPKDELCLYSAWPHFAHSEVFIV